MTAQIAVFQPAGVEGSVHGSAADPVRCGRIVCDTDLTIHFDHDADPTAALAQIDAMIEGLHAFRHEVVEKAEQVPA